MFYRKVEIKPYENYKRKLHLYLLLMLEISSKLSKKLLDTIFFFLNLMVLYEIYREIF
jgi:hypothetical protein